MKIDRLFVAEHHPISITPQGDRSLQALAAYIEQGRDVALLHDFKPEAATEPDPLLAAIWEGEQPTRFAHLINHQADGGYYLPVDFPEPIWLEFDEETGEDGHDIQEPVVSFGSSTALQRELVDLEPLLQKAGVLEQSAPYRCLRVLREAVDQSINNDLPIIIW